MGTPNGVPILEFCSYRTITSVLDAKLVPLAFVAVIEMVQTLLLARPLSVTVRFLNAVLPVETFTVLVSEPLFAVTV